MLNEGFVDLRMDTQHRQSDDTVWPSFTDIMTVVVMIFLFALVVILIRNVELVNQLRATMEAERAAAEIAKTTEEQRASLSAQLVALDEKLSALRLQLLQSQEKQQETGAQLTARSQELSKTQSERDTLRAQLTARNQELSKTQSERDSLRAQSRELAAERDALTSRLSTALSQQEALSKTKTQLEQELTIAQQLQAQQEGEITKLREQQSGQEQQLLNLRGEYTSLKKKYDRLVRPARTALGKYVIEVKYQKIGGKFVIGVREPKQSEYKNMSSEQMHRRLAQLKQRWGNKLYTKIVIPENSGLSYSEAWQFTNDVLSRYDYYYQ